MAAQARAWGAACGTFRSRSSAKSCSPDALIIPLVGFDDACYRLGYGGGYYDRTLAAATKRPYCVGLGYSNGALGTIYPQMHDIPLDMIVDRPGARSARSLSSAGGPHTVAKRRRRGAILPARSAGKSPPSSAIPDAPGESERRQRRGHVKPENAARIDLASVEQQPGRRAHPAPRR